jgi:hypothetical protein
MKNFENNRGPARMPRSGGLIKMILIIVAALVLVKYVYDIDVVGYLTTGKFRDWLDKLYGLASGGWREYNNAFFKGWDYLSGLAKNLANTVKK